MKMAIISLTTSGRKLAQEISRNLEEDHTVLNVDLFHKNVVQTLKDIINQYDCILGIMASGIMVRTICPLIQNKIQDPAVLVMDEDMAVRQNRLALLQDIRDLTKGYADFSELQGF